MAVNTVAASAAPQITGAIRQAAHSTGISFEYLLTTAQIESNLNPAAQASTSSAKGLYQFIEQTWLATMKADGPAHGYGSYAEGIFRGSDGHYEVPNPVLRAAIMRLRSDPTESAMMAGAFARNNAAQLRAAIGRDPTEGELYIAHFLGSDGAGKLIGAATTQPRANAAELFPQAAAANRNIFFDSAGSPRSERCLCQADQPFRGRPCGQFRARPAHGRQACRGASRFAVRAASSLVPRSRRRHASASGCQ